MLTEFYLNNPNLVEEQFPFVIPRKDSLVNSPFSIYNYIYAKSLVRFNETFSE